MHVLVFDRTRLGKRDLAGSCFDILDAHRSASCINFTVRVEFLPYSFRHFAEQCSNVRPQMRPCL